MKKAELRRLLSARAAAIPAEKRRTYSEKIARAVLQSDVYRRAHSVFIYVSTPFEPDTRPILADAFRSGKRVYVPKCVDEHTMLAVEITGTADLVPGIWGIPEPAHVPEPYAPPTLDLAVVPCVGASPGGARLGHGAGYYDRFFENCETYKLCLCFADLLTDEIPMLPHDVLMDAVITESWETFIQEKIIP